MTPKDLIAWAHAGMMLVAVLVVALVGAWMVCQLWRDLRREPPTRQPPRPPNVAGGPYNRASRPPS